MFDDFEVIHTYSRREALEDGALVDVSELGKEVGFRRPVALTAAVWAECVAVPKAMEKTGQDEASRVRDVLSKLLIAILLSNHSGRVLGFKIRVFSSPPRRVEVPLKAVFGPDDDGEPCVTIMLPDED